MELNARYLDSSVVLDLIEPASMRHAQVEARVRSTPPDEFRVSNLVRMECLIQALRTQDAHRLADLRAFFSSVVVLPLDTPVFDLAADLRAQHQGLKTPDALHLATARRHGCAEFWTNDLDLVRKPAGLTFRTF